ncbi:hypothetical protein SDC9_175221 [bioreactor metagenome]|uniref:Uncharacterized protein n=1 Tax=bioreactor metagenome TaxID=1076179 RepID=A0A645GLM8_9ZZZZ
MVVHTITQAYNFECFFGSLDAIFGTQAIVHQRQHDVLKGCGSRQQVELLKHKSDLVGTQVSKLVFGHLLHFLAIDIVRTSGGNIQTAQNCH